jgi:Zn-finger protein
MKKTMVMILVLMGLVWAQDFEYVGAKGCKACHSSSKKGAQYKVWAASAHANAFETLKTEEAAKIAKEKGLEVPAYEAGECLSCHTTGYGKGGYEVKDEEFWNPAEDDKAGKKAVKRMKGLQAVSCEACHGPGSGYKKKKIMEEIFAGALADTTVGLSMPNEDTCLGCHNEKSPTYKKFSFEEYVKTIAHPYPPEMKQ